MMMTLFSTSQYVMFGTKKILNYLRFKEQQEQERKEGELGINIIHCVDSSYANCL